MTPESPKRVHKGLETGITKGGANINFTYAMQISVAATIALKTNGITPTVHPLPSGYLIYVVLLSFDGIKAMSTL